MISLGAILAAPFIGIMLSLFGAGGGMLSVPLLHHGFGMPLKSAVVASLWIVIAVSLVAFMHQRSWRQLHVRLLIFFAVGGSVGSWLGAKMGLAISDTWQALCFALLVWFVAWWMRYRHQPLRQQAVEPSCRCLVTLLTGVLLGIVTGLLGVGGGFMMVPALLWLGLPDYKQAVNHSLVLIVMNAMVASVTYYGRVELPWQPVLWVAVLAAIGTVIGAVLTRRFSSAHLQSVFSVFLVLIGAVMLYDAF